MDHYIIGYYSIGLGIAILLWLGTAITQKRLTLAAYTLVALFWPIVSCALVIYGVVGVVLKLMQVEVPPPPLKGKAMSKGKEVIPADTKSMYGGYTP